jgi:hypothetical protein
MIPNRTIPRLALVVGCKRLAALGKFGRHLNIHLLGDAIEEEADEDGALADVARHGTT